MPFISMCGDWETGGPLSTRSLQIRAPFTQQTRNQFIVNNRRMDERTVSFVMT